MSSSNVSYPDLPEGFAVCTESLGDETGIFYAFEPPTFPPFAEESSGVGTSKPRRANRNRKNYNFPPPLTSMSGSSGIRLVPHREDGRLILKAVPVAYPVNHVEAERGDERLRLRMVSQMPYYISEEEVEEDDEQGGGETEIMEDMTEVETETMEEDMEESSGVAVVETRMENKQIPSPGNKRNRRRRGPLSCCFASEA